MKALIGRKFVGIGGDFDRTNPSAGGNCWRRGRDLNMERSFEGLGKNGNWSWKSAKGREGTLYLLEICKNYFFNDLLFSIAYFIKSFGGSFETPCITCINKL
jgi:hypothetical protein